MENDWMTNAACVTAPEWVDFAPFTLLGEDPTPAQAYCASCPVTAMCLLWGRKPASQFEDHGIWGGTTDVDRVDETDLSCPNCGSTVVFMQLLTGDEICDTCGVVKTGALAS